MAGKKAALTPAQIRSAGWIVEQYVPLGSGAITRANPWCLRRLGSQERAQRFATRDEAIGFLKAEIEAEGAP